jgi:type IV pilus assembly protein PilB
MITQTKPILPHGMGGLPRLLVQAGHMSVEQARTLLQRAREQRMDFMAAVIEQKVLTAAEMAQAIVKALGLPYLNLDEYAASSLPVEGLDSLTARKLQVMALECNGKRLLLATADPTNKETYDRIKASTQLIPEWVVVEYDKLMRLLAASAGPASDWLEAVQDVDFGMITLDTNDANSATETEQDIEDAPVVRFLKKMLVDAINMRASDLHFEPYEHVYRVRFRVDGQLREIQQPPLVIKDRLAARIKVISRLDIAEKRVPQDGRVKLQFGTRSIDFRVSTLPTLHGEKIVIRILDASAMKLGMDALGYEPIEKERLLHAIARPYGMILVTGPTGSGKTVSLYTCLGLLNQPGVNIATVEDPAEINLPGVNQVNVNEKAGLGFAEALRAFLRQDPDIIMVGEIRDLETADIAIKAAQTGHLVLSTLHTNDAPSTLMRLTNMGVAPFNIASSVLLITAQRLARQLCAQCKQPALLPPEALLEAGFSADQIDGTWQPYRAVGCSACSGGYRGRTGIYQVMPITEAIQQIILHQGSVMDIAQQAKRDGVLNLRQSGLLKVLQGLTSLEEVLAVTNE